ncbi:hypothetical protein GCM10023175_62140 [Pseudonocardia xishanensis]|uniref:Uncharacterized protein n=1 Tax=Pseudonocardia xishanensis TaxID=630995 RepID=A0ABP8S173_9PSEU
MTGSSTSCARKAFKSAPVGSIAIDAVCTAASTLSAPPRVAAGERDDAVQRRRRVRDFTALFGEPPTHYALRHPR